MNKIDYHCHFEGSIPWNAFAKLFLKNKDFLIASNIKECFTFDFQLEVANKIIELLTSNTSEEDLTKYLTDTFTLHSPAENLLEFIKRLPTAFIRWSCKDIEDLRLLLESTLNNYESYRRVELFFCPFAQENGRYDWKDVCKLFSDVWSKLEPQKQKVFTFVLSLRKGQKDVEMENVKEVVSASNEYLNLGITKLDIAGDENAFPYPIYKEQIKYVLHNSKLKLTLHIGETTPRDLDYIISNFPEVRQFNHGVQIYQDEKLMSIAKKRNIFFTVCPESNLFTGALSLMEINKVLAIFKKNKLNFGWGSDDKAIIGSV